MARAGSASYLSLAPGGIPLGVSAALQNLRSREQVGTWLVDGGFDPVAIGADDGDTIAVDVRVLRLDEPRRFFVVTPPRRAPSVIRTQPISGKRDVSTAVSMFVVFAEPMDTTVLRADAIMLYDLFGRTPVRGSLAFIDSAHVTVGFRPLAPLAAARVYELVVTDVGRDLDGDSAEELRVRFTTAREAPPEALLSGKLAFHAWGGEDPGIFTMRPDGFDLQRLTDGIDPQWSPDGTRLAFWRGDGSGSYSVHVIDADGTGEVVLARGYDPTWSPDGQHIAFGCGGICVMNADGSNVTAITTHDLPTVQGETCITDSNPRWSPDGSTIAFMRFPAPWPRYGPDGRQCLTKSISLAFAFDFLPSTILIAPDGSDERPLPASLSGIYGWPVWSPDGTFMAAYTFDDLSGSIFPAVVVARSDGSGTGTFAYVSENPWAMSAPVWSPDGSRLIVGDGRQIIFVTPTGSDVYAIDPPHPWGLDWNVSWSWSRH
jgi:hypothetical protein